MYLAIFYIIVKDISTFCNKSTTSLIWFAIKAYFKAVPFGPFITVILLPSSEMLTLSIIILSSEELLVNDAHIECRVKNVVQSVRKTIYFEIYFER